MQLVAAAAMLTVGRQGGAPSVSKQFFFLVWDLEVQVRSDPLPLHFSITSGVYVTPLGKDENK